MAALGDVREIRSFSGDDFSFVGVEFKWGREVSVLRMEVKGKILEDMNLSNTERLSKIEDADITEAIMNLKSVEFAYQATLASSSKVMTMSLVDYLR